jgi:homocysteine S-methyltransferase
MAKYRANLPQLTGGTFLSDGGIETTFIFHEGMELPHFASFVLLANKQGRQRLKNYYVRYLMLAQKYGVGFILDTPTWRANADWGTKLGYGPQALGLVSKDAVGLMAELRNQFETPSTPCVISVAIGPRGDGYKAGLMDIAEAEAYHTAQIVSVEDSEADMVTAYTLTNVAEAIGIARAARTIGMPCAISFTLETDGRLVTGRTLRDAIETVDDAGRVRCLFHGRTQRISRRYSIMGIGAAAFLE